MLCKHYMGWNSVKHNGTSCNQWTEQRAFPHGRHLCSLVTLILANEEMLERDDILACLTKDPVGTESGKCVHECSPVCACDVFVIQLDMQNVRRSAPNEVSI